MLMDVLALDARKCFKIGILALIGDIELEIQTTCHGAKLGLSMSCGPATSNDSSFHGSTR